MRKTLLSLAAALFLALPAFATPPAVDPGNDVRTYGWVVQNYNHGPSFGNDGILLVHIPSLSDTVRLDYLGADDSGAIDLVTSQWVAINSYLDGELGCLDGPTTAVRPLIVYRWTGTSWEIWDRDLASWVAWP